MVIAKDVNFRQNHNTFSSESQKVSKNSLGRKPADGKWYLTPCANQPVKNFIFIQESADLSVDTIEYLIKHNKTLGVWV